MENSKPTIRIATWNLARPRKNGWTKNQRCLNKINEINADLWVLTETNSAICPGSNYATQKSHPIQGYHQTGEHLSMIWSRWEILDSIPTFDPAHAVCAEIKSPIGLMLVYGTVIPYANEKGPYGTDKRWEAHRRSIQQHYQDWLYLRQNYPNHLLCIAGDFNQNRDGTTWYKDQQSVEQLTTALQALSLDCVTEMDMRKEFGLSRASVDHICLCQSLQSRLMKVNAWEGKTANNQKISDHNGVFVDLAERQTK